MKKSIQLAAVMGTSALVSFGALMVVPSGEGPGKSGSYTLADLLDPTFASRNLCGHEGSERGAFFRPDVMQAFMGQAAVAEEEVPDVVPLWDGLKGHGFQISTDNAAAQAYFDQGVALLFGFNHWESIRAFKEAQRLDPACAICYWGEAYAYGANINAPMDPKDVEPAFAAISKAMVLKSGASEKEAALIEALAARYTPDKDADRAPLDKAYTAAMKSVHEAYPDDLNIATFYAESVMDLSPWDYYERDFVTMKPEIKPAVDTVEAVLAKKPDHPGAIHLYIHLTEPSRTPERAEPFADLLAAQLPDAGHLVHMPGHTFFRVGRYLDALSTNVEAVRVDEAYLDSTEGSDIYRYGYYPHNVHFVLVSAQMAGDADITLEFARKLDDLLPIEMVETAPWVQPIKASPLFAYLQYGDAEAIAALEEPPQEAAYLNAMWHYVQGVSAARQGDLAGAHAHSAAIAANRANPLIAELDAQDVPGTTVLDLAETMVKARIAQADGKTDEALSLMERAVELQGTIPYTEPPYWYYPVQQTQGAILMQAGRHQEAIKAFRDSLIMHPNNAWSLYGLMKAQDAAGDAAASFTKELYEKASKAKGPIPVGKL
ncbi:MAG: tetratricopeptide repeat protein [Alphaproteobacteria bacterium]|nr:MAG: tetratricopeptide repeat protein [Alphaproteobacteria bacterium]